MPTFQILIATVNKPSLRVMLHSLVRELHAEDCLTVVFDNHESVPDVVSQQPFQCTIKTYCEPKKLGFWGHGIRNHYKHTLEPRTFVLHADDDDMYVPGSFAKLRDLCTDPNQLQIAQMRWKDEIKPPGPFIKRNHIGTPCGIIPQKLNSLGHWSSFVGGDFHFQKQLETFSESKPVYLNFVFYIVDPTDKDSAQLCLESYSRHYPDVHAAYNFHKQGLLFHQFNYGILEGRQLCWCFTSSLND